MANVDGSETGELSIAAVSKATRSGVIVGRWSARGIGCGWLLAASAWIGLTALPSGPGWARHVLNTVMAVGFWFLGVGILVSWPCYFFEMEFGIPKVRSGRRMKRRLQQFITGFDEGSKDSLGGFSISLALLVTFLVAPFDHGVSKWFADLALGMQLAAVAGLAIVYYLVIYPITTEERRRTLVTARYMSFGESERPNWITNSFVIVAITAISIATISAILTVLIEHTGVKFVRPTNLTSLPKRQVVATAMVSRVVLHDLLSSIPIVSIPETLNWARPAKVQGPVGGWLMLIFKVTAGIGIVAVVRTLWLELKRNPSDSLGDQPKPATPDPSEGRREKIALLAQPFRFIRDRSSHGTTAQ